jgi:hypothetical protein
MPRLTRWFVKTALVYLVAALFVWVVEAAQTVLNLPLVIATVQPTYLHLFTVGWITQMIFGVAYWMFPRASRVRPRGSETLAAAVYGLINMGLVLRVIAEPFRALRPGLVPDWLLTASALLQSLAGVCFVISIWGRVKEK